MHDTALIHDRVAFLSQDADQLRAVRGRDLYDRLNNLGLNHNHFFRALGTSVQDYCAEEFGVDLGRISVDRFFQSDPNAKWLFPDIVREAVLDGMQRKPLYPELIIRDEAVAGTAYDVPYIIEDESQEELRSLAEGAVIPESELIYGDRIVRLDKLGRGIIASYEVIRRMSVDMLRIHLRRIGECLGRNLDARLAQVLIEGDGSNASTEAVSINSATAGAWSYADLVTGFNKLTLDHYFTPTHILASANTLASLLNASELKDSTLFDFAKTGNLPTPLGVKLAPMADQPDDKITFVDANYAVQKLTEQDLLVEADKLIHQQWERTFLTVVTNFAVIYDKARVVLNNDWS